MFSLKVGYVGRWGTRWLKMLVSCLDLWSYKRYLQVRTFSVKVGIIWTSVWNSPKLFLHSGVITTLEEIEPHYRHFCDLLPATKLVEAFRSVCSRGSGISSGHVVPVFISALGWVSLSLVVATLMERRRRKWVTLKC